MTLETTSDRETGKIAKCLVKRTSARSCNTRLFSWDWQAIESFASERYTTEEQCLQIYRYIYVEARARTRLRRWRTSDDQLRCQMSVTAIGRQMSDERRDNPFVFYISVLQKNPVLTKRKNRSICPLDHAWEILFASLNIKSSAWKKMISSWTASSVFNALHREEPCWLLETEKIIFLRQVLIALWQNTTIKLVTKRSETTSTTKTTTTMMSTLLSWYRHHCDSRLPLRAIIGLSHDEMKQPLPCQLELIGRIIGCQKEEDTEEKYLFDDPLPSLNILSLPLPLIMLCQNMCQPIHHSSKLEYLSSIVDH